MKSVPGGWVVFGMLAGFWLGTSAVITADQLQLLARVARPTPQLLSVAELIDKGPGDNLHVELIGYSFGQPVIEKNGDFWQAVWVPVQPAWVGKTPPAKTVILRAAWVQNQAQLDELLQQSTLKALVTTPLSGSSLRKAQPSDAIRKAYAKVPADKMIYLSNSDLVLGSTTVSAEVLFGGTVARVVGWTATGFFTFGAFCLLLLFRGGPAETGRTEHVGSGREHERARLETEIPTSTHRRDSWGCFCRACRRLVLAAVVFLVSVVPVVAALAALDRSSPVTAIVLFLIGLLILWAVQAIVWRAIWMFHGTVAEIAVCHGGLRWRIGTQQQRALWADVGGVHVVEQIVRQGGVRMNTVGYCAIRFRTGGTLDFWSDSLTELVWFVRAVQAEVQAVNQEVASRAMSDAFLGTRTGGRASH